MNRIANHYNLGLLQEAGAPQSAQAPPVPVTPTSPPETVTVRPCYTQLDSDSPSQQTAATPFSFTDGGRPLTYEGTSSIPRTLPDISNLY
jgi:hypothetical protein